MVSVRRHGGAGGVAILARGYAVLSCLCEGFLTFLQDLYEFPQGSPVSSLLPNE